MSGTPRRDQVPRDLPPADSTPPTSEAQQHGAKAVSSSKTKIEVEHLLLSLEKEGVQINDKIASIVDAEIAKIIKAETSRDANKELKRERRIPIWSVALAACGLTVYTVASISFGFAMGVDWFHKAFREEFARRTKKFNPKRQSEDKK